MIQYSEENDIQQSIGTETEDKANERNNTVDDWELYQKMNDQQFL